MGVYKADRDPFFERVFMKKSEEMSGYFPLADWYAPEVPSRAFVARETAAKGRIFGYSERHVQAVWFDPRWRPDRMMTLAGEMVEVEFPGTWNLEAGPDFLGAALLVGPDRRRITGDVEVHIFPADWRHHHHADDPRYRRVCAHVTYFEGALRDDELPPGTQQIALRSVLKCDPSFAFEHIDVTTYPYAGRADIPPCRDELSLWRIEDRTRLLESAGHARLRLKSERFADAIIERGADQTLYEAVLAAIGYQHNKRPFHELARRLPVETLRRISRGEVKRTYALLAGMSGLLPSDWPTAWDDETRGFVRELWDIWWKERDQLPDPMTRTEWQLHGIRPLNHPLRRMMAAAMVFACEGDGHILIESWLRDSCRETMVRLESSFMGSNAPYWPLRVSLGGVKQKSPTALLGQDRLESLLINVVLPLAAAFGYDAHKVRSCLTEARPETINHIMKQTAFYLLGPDYPSLLLASAGQRQGLLQIFHDHCLHDRSHCARCAFPAWLNKTRNQA